MSESREQPTRDKSNNTNRKSPTESLSDFLHYHRLSPNDVAMATPTDLDSTESCVNESMEVEEQDLRNPTPTDLDTTESVDNMTNESYTILIVEKSDEDHESIRPQTPSWSDMSYSIVDDSVNDPDYNSDSRQPREQNSFSDATRSLSNLNIDNEERTETINEDLNKTISDIDTPNKERNDSPSILFEENYKKFNISTQEMARCSTPIIDQIEREEREDVNENDSLSIFASSQAEVIRRQISNQIETEEREDVNENDSPFIFASSQAEKIRRQISNQIETEEREDLNENDSPSIFASSQAEEILRQISNQIETEEREDVNANDSPSIFASSQAEEIRRQISNQIETEDEENIIQLANEEDEIRELETSSQNLEPNQEVNYSKSENRLRRQMEKRTEKINKFKRKHPIDLSVCAKCSNNCNKFNDTERRQIWNTYWSLNYSSRRKWLAACIKTVSVQRRRVKDAGAIHRKKESRTYFFKKEGKDERVCLSFFLKTLGYTSDSVITELRKADKRGLLMSQIKENRGRQKNVKSCNYDLIKSHINSYNPCVAHYRRHNAPNMRYLPMGLTLRALYKDFDSKHPKACSMETYRKTLIDLGISLHTPENDICSDCTYYDKVKNDCEANGEEIPEDVKEKFDEHSKKASDATKEYNKDKDKQEGRLLKIYSMDLQKVILIPIMPKVKDTFFISRLVVFNETFASLKAGEQNYCCLWHEAIAGRDAPQIIDAMLAFIREERDTENLIFWADNCCAQNKNWFLFTAMVTFVNSNVASQFLQTITMKYLTKGHTHMTADAIHGNIERALKKKGDTYDYKDLKDTIKESRRNLKVVDVDDFHKWQKKRRQPRHAGDTLRDVKLNNIVEVKFTRGSRKMLYKESFEETEYKEVSFLQARHNAGIEPVQETTPRGIDSAKKQQILNKLVRLMPRNRENFWTELPVKENAIDLITGGQFEDDDNEA